LLAAISLFTTLHMLNQNR